MTSLTIKRSAEQNPLYIQQAASVASEIVEDSDGIEAIAKFGSKAFKLVKKVNGELGAESKNLAGAFGGTCDVIGALAFIPLIKSWAVDGNKRKDWVDTAKLVNATAITTLSTALFIDEYTPAKLDSLASSIAGDTVSGVAAGVGAAISVLGIVGGSLGIYTASKKLQTAEKVYRTALSKLQAPNLSKAQKNHLLGRVKVQKAIKNKAVLDIIISIIKIAGGVLALAGIVGASVFAPGSVVILAIGFSVAGVGLGKFIYDKAWNSKWKKPIEKYSKDLPQKKKAPLKFSRFFAGKVKSRELKQGKIMIKSRIRFAQNLV